MECNVEAKEINANATDVEKNDDISVDAPMADTSEASSKQDAEVPKPSEEGQDDGDTWEKS